MSGESDPPFGWRIPTNYDRIRDQMPTVEWMSGAVAHPDQIEARIREHVAAVVGAFPGGRREQVEEALTDLLFSLAPSFAPAAGLSDFGLDDWNDWDQNTLALGPTRVHAAGTESEPVTVIQTNLVHVGPFGSIAATRRNITFEAIVIRDSARRLHRHVD